MNYAQKIHALLSPLERRVLQKLSTPNKIQDFLDSFPINFEETGETILSPRRLLQEKRAHCIEGAVFAAAALAYHGREPLLLDLQTLPHDHDHVVALFKEKGLWGAISKTNHTTLRFRDPVYKTVRELALSYFHEYFLEDGKKTLRAYSKPFNLKRYKPKSWLIAEEDLDWLAIDLDDSPHSPIAPKKVMQALRKTSRIERESLALVEWKYPKNYKGN